MVEARQVRLVADTEEAGPGHWSVVIRCAVSLYHTLHLHQVEGATDHQ